MAVHVKMRCFRGSGRILSSKTVPSPSHRVYLSLECNLMTEVARDDLNSSATFVDEVNDGKISIRMSACANGHLHGSRTIEIL